MYLTISILIISYSIAASINSLEDLLVHPSMCNLICLIKLYFFTKLKIRMRALEHILNKSTNRKISIV